MIARQFDLFGGTAVAGDVVEAVRHVLETDAGARDSYMEVIGQVWFLRDGLDSVLPPECHDGFLRWLRRDATSPKTIQNRCMELQRMYPELAASPVAQERRKRQATQGPVR